MGVTDDDDRGVRLLSPGEEELDLGEADFDQPFVEDGYDLDDALDATGNGPFQLMLVFCVFLAWAFNSMITTVTPFFLSGMRKDLGLTAEQEGIVASSLLVGYMFGNVAWGVLSDKYGRKWCIIAGVFGVGLFNSLAALGAAWWHVALVRTCVGFNIAGSMIAANSLVSELVPRSSRGRWLVFLHVSWQVGTMTMVYITYYLHGREEWRELMLATGAPAVFIVAIMLAVGLPESPRYLLLKKHRTECMEVLERVARVNGKSLPEDQQLMDVPPRPSIRPLAEIFNASLLARTTLPLWVMFFWLNYGSYGLTMWLKAYLGQLGMSDMVRDLYVWLAIGKVAGVLACALVIEWVPRRRALGCSFVAAGVCTFVAVMMNGGEDVADTTTALVIDANMRVVLMFALAAFFEEAAWGLMYTYSVEVYPSTMRSTGSGAAMAFGRFGGIIATGIGKKLMMEDPRLPFYMVAMAFLLSAVAVGVSRHETKGAKLVDV